MENQLSPLPGRGGGSSKAWEGPRDGQMEITHYTSCLDLVSFWIGGQGQQIREDIADW